MEKYKVKITIRTEKTVWVEAADEIAAIHKAEEQNRRGDYNIYDAHYAGCSYETENMIKEDNIA